MIVVSCCRSSWWLFVVVVHIFIEQVEEQVVVDHFAAVILDLKACLLEEGHGVDGVAAAVDVVAVVDHEVGGSADRCFSEVGGTRKSYVGGAWAEHIVNRTWIDKWMGRLRFQGLKKAKRMDERQKMGGSDVLVAHRLRSLCMRCSALAWFLLSLI